MKESRKPDRVAAMKGIIEQVKNTLPLYAPETFVCGTKGNCVGCPKKLLEMVDSELSYWESAIDRASHRSSMRFADLVKCAQVLSAA